MSTHLADYDYSLPRELIAQHPLPRREDSRMMVLHRDEQKIEHARFVDLKKLLRDGGPSRTGGYLIVLNNSRVFPERDFSDDLKFQVLLAETIAPCLWKA